MIAQSWTSLRTQLAKERRIAALGLLGMVLGGACALVGLVGGFEVPPEGNLWETATFNGAVGFFLLTQALLVPEAGFSAKGRTRWGTALIVATLYAYGIETVQAFRGLDPRFSNVAGATDQILGGVFFLDALFIMVLFYALTWRFFRAPATPLRVAVRYAAATALVSFGVGIAMSASGGRLMGAAGNLLPIHAVGFHGLQAIPLVALLLAWGGVPDSDAKRWVHAAGLAWAGLCVAVLSQAGVGQAPTELSPALVVSGAFAAAWLASALVAARAWARREGEVTEALG